MVLGSYGRRRASFHQQGGPAPFAVLFQRPHGQAGDAMSYVNRRKTNIFFVPIYFGFSQVMNSDFATLFDPFQPLPPRSLVSLYTRGNKKQSKCEIYTRTGRKRGVNFMEVLINHFYVNFQARGSIRNIIVSFVMYLLINITNVYGSTPPTENFQFRSGPSPHYAQKIGEKTKTYFTVSTVLRKKRSTVKVGGFAHFCYFQRPERGGVGSHAKNTKRRVDCTYRPLQIGGGNH